MFTKPPKNETQSYSYQLWVNSSGVVFRMTTTLLISAIVGRLPTNVRKLKGFTYTSMFYSCRIFLASPFLPHPSGCGYRKNCIYQNSDFSREFNSGLKPERIINRLSFIHTLKGAASQCVIQLVEFDFFAAFITHD